MRVRTEIHCATVSWISQRETEAIECFFAARGKILARQCLALRLGAVILALTATPSAAEVRFGNNVFIGGHNASNQTFNSQRRGEYCLYEGKPAHPGCDWRANADGSRTKVCHLQRRR
jgi:hypothetical protein